MNINFKGASLHFALLTISVLLCPALSSPLLAQMNHGAHSGPTMNHHVIDEQLATGGHIVDDGLKTLVDEGYTVIIDLRDEPPKGQKKALADAGIEWINIPVEWRDPKVSDFEAFAKAMEANKDAKVLVQCQANYRASAMTYLYQVTSGDEPEPQARKDLEAIWTPNEQWQEYMDGIIAAAD